MLKFRFCSLVRYLPRPTACLPLCLEFQILAALVLAALVDIPFLMKESLIFSYPAGIMASEVVCSYRRGLYRKEDDRWRGYRILRKPNQRETILL